MMPPKVSMSGRTENEVRQSNLQKYLRELVKVPNIFDSIMFRKFLKIEPSTFKEYFVFSTLPGDR